MVILTTVFLFLTAVITSISVQCDYKTATPYFQKSVYEFTLKLVKKLNEETDGHFLTSALSPWTLLTAISLGASNTTLHEIKEVLQLHPYTYCFVYFYLDLVNEVTMKPNNPRLSMVERSSTIFFNASVNVSQSFFDDLSKGGFWNSRIMYFVNRNETADSINAHVRSSTDNTIPKMVTPNDLVGISTLTIDAMTFKGAWKMPFPYEDIESDAFYDEDKQEIGGVSMMYLSETFNVTRIPQIKAAVLELPYYGDEYSMLIFLPVWKVSLKEMLDSMKSINISSIFQQYEQSRPTKINVQIPRFRMSSIRDNWKKTLKSIGINTIFDQHTDFPGTRISHYQLFLTNFIQKAELEVNEEGWNIGRATDMLMQSRFMYDDFVVNRPFMYMIVDRVLHVPIFTGAYSKPSFYCDD